MQPLFDSKQNYQDALIGMEDIVRLLFKHKWTILLTFIIVSLVISLCLISLPPVYTAQGKILVKTELQGKPVFFAGVTSYNEQRESDPVNRKMETEMQLVTTRSIAEQTVRELDIKYNQVFHKPLEHLLEPVANAVDFVLLNVFSIEPDPENQGFNDTTSEFIKSINVQPVRSKSAETSSNIMELAIRAHDPDLVKDGLQRVMELYVQYDSDINEESGLRAKRIISGRQQQAFTEMQSVQQEIETFLSANNGAEELRDNRRNQSALFSSPNDISSIVAMRKKVVDKELEMDELRQRFSSSSERVKTVRRTIARLERRISDEMQLFAINDSKLSNLERRLAIAEEVYRELTKKISQIDLFLDMNELHASNRIIIESPIKPRDSEWKKRIFLAILGSILGGILGVGLAGLREYLDTRVETAKSLRKQGMKVLGVIPDLPSKQYDACVNSLRGK